MTKQTGLWSEQPGSGGSAGGMSLLLAQLDKVGIEVREIDGELAAKLELKGCGGVCVVGMKPGGAAEKAGITWGDVVREIDGTAIGTGHDLEKALASHKPGLPVRFLSSRGGRLYRLAVWLAQ